MVLPVNIATNFQGALIYIQDCEPITGDTFQVDRTDITLTCVNYDMSKNNFKKCSCDASVGLKKTFPEVELLTPMDRNTTEGIQSSINSMK